MRVVHLQSKPIFSLAAIEGEPEGLVVDVSATKLQKVVARCLYWNAARLFPSQFVDANLERRLVQCAMLERIGFCLTFTILERDGEFRLGTLPPAFDTACQFRDPVSECLVQRIVECALFIFCRADEFYVESVSVGERAL
jgi:hypothetical protein